MRRGGRWRRRRPMPAGGSARPAPSMCSPAWKAGFRLSSTRGRRLAALNRPMSRGPVRLWRRGRVEVDAVESSGNLEAPGMLASHYAPSKPVRLDATEARAGEYLLGFGPVAGQATLSASGDLVEAAARLFDLLHEADAATELGIAVAPIPGDGLAAAIRDRLQRAAAPRSPLPPRSAQT